MGHAKTLPPGYYHHCEPETAYHSSKLGMWMFLATEVHLFTVMFMIYGVLNMNHPAVFEHGHHALNWKLGAVNTAVLLISSYLMVRAVDAAQKGQNKRCFNFLLWTFICAIGFLVIKSIEYTAKFSHGVGPWTDPFYGIYFTMTGVHAVHVIVGMGVILWLMKLAKDSKFSTTYYTPVEVVGLYWHLVDAIWIFLFPLLYLSAGI